MQTRKGQTVLLHNLWEWAKEVLREEELNNMFLAKDGYERTAWNMSPIKGQIEALPNLWELAKNILTQGELNDMFLTKDGDEKTVWHMVA